MCAVLNDTRHHRFLIGTSTLKDPKNHVYLVNYDEDELKINLQGLFNHDGEIWKMSSSPYNSNHIVTASSSTPNEF